MANAFIAAGAYEDLNGKCNLENRCSQLTWRIDAFNNASIPSDAIPPSQNITWFVMDADDFGDIDCVYEFPSGFDNSEPVKHDVTSTAAVPRAGSWDDAAPLVAIPCASAAPFAANIPGDGTDILEDAAPMAAFPRASAAPLAAKVAGDCSDIWYDVAPLAAVPCAPAAPLAAEVLCDCSDNGCVGPPLGGASAFGAACKLSPMHAPCCGTEGGADRHHVDIIAQLSLHWALPEQGRQVHQQIVDITVLKKQERIVTVPQTVPQKEPTFYLVPRPAG